MITTFSTNERMRHKFETVHFTGPEDLAQQISDRLDLGHFSQLWEDQGDGLEILQGATVFVALHHAPDGCTEGRLMARLVACGEHETKHKGWPRYYFDRVRAKRELEQWMLLNGQLKFVVNPTETQHT